MCLTSQKQEAAARAIRGSSAHCPAPTELCLQALSHSAAPLQLSLLRAGLTLHEPYGRQQYSSIPGGGRLLLDPACEILLLPCAAPWRLNSIQGLGREAGRKWVYFLSVAQQSIKYLQRDLLIAAAGMGGALCSERRRRRRVVVVVQSSFSAPLPRPNAARGQSSPGAHRHLLLLLLVLVKDKQRQAAARSWLTASALSCNVSYLIFRNKERHGTQPDCCGGDGASLGTHGFVRRLCRGPHVQPHCRAGAAPALTPQLVCIPKISGGGFEALHGDGGRCLQCHPHPTSALCWDVGPRQHPEGGSHRTLLPNPTPRGPRWPHGAHRAEGRL